jgi:Tfp pilus assembly protein PilO
MRIHRPFLEQNQKLQATEAELQELHRRLREKDLQVAELKNLLNKSMFNMSLGIDRLTDQT